MSKGKLNLTNSHRKYTVKYTYIHICLNNVSAPPYRWDTSSPKTSFFGQNSCSVKKNNKKNTPKHTPPQQQKKGKQTKRTTIQQNPKNKLVRLKFNLPSFRFVLALQI